MTLHLKASTLGEILPLEPLESRILNSVALRDQKIMALSLYFVPGLLIYGIELVVDMQYTQIPVVIYQWRAIALGWHL